MNDLVLDASLALRWFLEDEADRNYSLAILSSLASKRAVVPSLWCYEVGNGLLMAHRRKRISADQMDAFLTRLRALPIDSASESPADILELPALALLHGLTSYDAAYLGVAKRLNLPLATNDAELRRAATSAGVSMVTP